MYNNDKKRKNNSSDNRQHKIQAQSNIKKQSIELEINNREITKEDILKLNLSLDENVWFFEHIDIYNEITDPMTKLELKTNIYKKYNDLKDIDEQITKMIVPDNILISNILHSDISLDIKVIIYRKYKNYIHNFEKNSSDEYSKLIDWINTIVSIPSKIININNDIEHKIHNLWYALNNKMACLNKVKEKIMETVCSQIINPQGTGKVLTFIGPPGVGKTQLSSIIATSMNLPFDQISFGSIKDPEILTGHSYTYVGSGPGLFVKSLIKSKQLNSVILLDEIDKISLNTEGRSVSSVLLHVLDKTQNNIFKDMYIPEININLSKILFICAANSFEEINDILRDRMTPIYISGYNINEKIEIGKKYLFPKILSEYGFLKDDIILDDHVIEYLITHNSLSQPGMRDVERSLSQLCGKLALLKHSSNNITLSYSIKDISFPLKITIKMIDKLMFS